MKRRGLRQRVSLVSALLLGLFVAMLLMTPEVSAYTGSHDETFIDNTYIDEVVSNATGMGTGAITLPRKAPQLMGVSNETHQSGKGVEVRGETACVLANGALVSSMFLYDVSDSANPELLSTTVLDFMFSYGMRLDWVGDIIYLPTRTGLALYNVSDPLNPDLLTDYDCTYGYQVVVQDNVAYLGRSVNGVRILNVTNPKAVTFIADYTDSIVDVAGIDVQGTILCTAENGAFDLVNVTDVYHPTKLIRAENTQSGNAGVAINGNLMVSSGSFSSFLYDISSPTTPVYLGNISVVHCLRCSFCSGYLCLWGVSLHMYDVSVPAAPQELFHILHLNNSNTCWAATVTSDFCYLTGNSQTLELYRYRDGVGNYWDRYSQLAVVQTEPICTCVGSATISDVVLQVDATTPTNTEIHYFVCATNESLWEEANPGVKVTPVPHGQQLRWRAVLSTSDFYTTPTVYSINVSYVSRLGKIRVLGPPSGYSPSGNTTQVAWEPDENAVIYLLQIDTTPAFDSSNLINISTYGLEGGPDRLWEATPPLSTGEWYWRIAGIDSQGGLGEFSNTSTFIITYGNSTETTTSTNTGTFPGLSDPTLYLVLGAAGVAIVAIVVVIRLRRK